MHLYQLTYLYHAHGITIYSIICTFYVVFLLFPCKGDSLTSEEVERLKERLQCLYKEEFSKIKTYLLDVDFPNELKEVYQNIALFSCNLGGRPISMTYEYLLNIITKENGKSRALFLGQAGVGKTTLLAKIALDWANGIRLQTIDLLFLVPFCETERCKQLAEIYKQLVSDPRLDNYMKANQEKIMLLFDGLDQYKGDIKRKDSNDALVKIIRGDKLKCAHVIVTTRTRRAEEITSIENFNEIYTQVLVEGFDKHSVEDYIKMFFEGDTKTAEGLIHLTTNPEGSIIAQAMGRYPNICYLLCYTWKWLQDSDRERVRKLQTFSEFIQEIVNVLVQQCALKNRNASLKDWESRCNESFAHIGKVAFDCLMERKISFNADEFSEIRDDIKIGFDVRVLTSKTHFADRDIMQKGGIKNNDVLFPNKLMQEYLAGYYLATLYPQNTSKFEGLIKNVFVNYKEYIHILYCTAAHGKEPGQTGKALIEVLCKALTGDNKEGDDVKFLVDIAYECHDEGVIGPVIEFLRQVKTLSLNALLENQHTWLAFIYTLAACGQQQVKLSF